MFKPTAVLAALLLATAVHAADPVRTGIDDTPSAGAMAFDLLLVRPLGLVSTVLGTGLFILQLPFDVAQPDGARAPFEKLVADPARFTFTRPLGSSE